MGTSPGQMTELVDWYEPGALDAATGEPTAPVLRAQIWAAVEDEGTDESRSPRGISRVYEATLVVYDHADLDSDHLIGYRGRMYAIVAIQRERRTWATLTLRTR